MDHYKDLLGLMAACLGLIGYALYFWEIARGVVKPHAFSWLVWSVLTGIAFAAQWSENGGAGSWVTAVTSLASIAVCLVALKKGDLHFPLFDWIALAVASVSILLWQITDNPTLSVILITIIDAAGFLPTFRKSFFKPYQESAIAFTLGTVKFIPAILALEAYSIATLLYPASLILMNGSFVLLLVIRRWQLRRITV